MVQTRLVVKFSYEVVQTVNGVVLKWRSEDNWLPPELHKLLIFDSLDLIFFFRREFEPLDTGLLCRF